MIKLVATPTVVEAMQPLIDHVGTAVAGQQVPDMKALLVQFHVDMVLLVATMRAEMGID